MCNGNDKIPGTYVGHTQSMFGNFGIGWPNSLQQSDGWFIEAISHRSGVTFYGIALYGSIGYGKYIGYYSVYTANAGDNFTDVEYD